MLSADALTDWVHASATGLSEAMAELSVTQWEQEVRTAQCRRVSACDIPWMRAREVFVHAVDLGLGLRFADLPVDFLAVLRNDIEHKRGISGPPGGIGEFPTSELTAWLAGRPHSIPRAPELGPWL